jgi:hypothetical protein
MIMRRRIGDTGGIPGTVAGPRGPGQSPGAAAVSMAVVTSWGCEIITAWLLLTSVVLAEARLAMSRRAELAAVPGVSAVDLCKTMLGEDISSLLK